VVGVLLSFSSDHAELGVTEIAHKLDLPKSAVHRILESLTNSGLVSRERDRGKYRLGPRAIELSLATLGTVDVRSLALPLMEALRDRTGETVTMSFLVNRERVYVAQVESRQDVRMTVEIGRRAPLYAGASGRAILMTFADNEVREYLDEVQLLPLTESTVQDRAQLLQMLAESSAQGFTTSAGERDPYAAAAAAPIRSRGSRAVGCLSVCGPRDRLRARTLEACGAAVVETAARLSDLLGG
jgi:DNA-binding IclR family transcriptional regulator